MSQPVQSLGAGPGAPHSGPGSKPIVATLLELLALRGRAVEGERAARALELGEAGLAEAPAWLAGDAIGRMFVAAGVEGDLARSIGHRLVMPEATGLLLYGLGLATPEKAYRRIQSLLPRESPGAQWSVEEIRDGSAQLAYRPDRTGAAGRSDPCDETNAPDQPDALDARSAVSSPGAEALCALRTGMLEAIPGLYGLLPARVRETGCVARGDEACRYRVVWQREVRAGLIWGLALGGGLALGLVTTIWLLTPGRLPDWCLPLAALTIASACGAVGRCLDLTRQLAAVAGARRGQLALLDQADDLLASKIDALARADAKLEGEPPTRWVRPALAGDGEVGAARAREGREVEAAALEIFSTAGELERWLDDQEAEDADAATSQRALVREIREWAARIVGERPPEVRVRRPVALGDLVARAVASVRPTVVPGIEAEIECEPDLPLVECEPVHIEQVVVQLLRNAVEASAGLMDVPRVLVRLCRAPGGVELSVEDRGAGIDSVEVDEVFDPFFLGQPLGAETGVGLPFCLRVVERHGGEMRIEAGDREGTRVTILMPESGRDEGREHVRQSGPASAEVDRPEAGHEDSRQDRQEEERTRKRAGRRRSRGSKRRARKRAGRTP